MEWVSIYDYYPGDRVEEVFLLFSDGSTRVRRTDGLDIRGMWEIPDPANEFLPLEKHQFKEVYVKYWCEVVRPKEFKSD